MNCEVTVVIVVLNMSLAKSLCQTVWNVDYVFVEGCSLLGCYTMLTGMVNTYWCFRGV